MKTYTFIVLVNIMACIQIPEVISKKTIWLNNTDFKSGSYIITEPGLYRLEEDIEFNPPKNVFEYLKKNSAFVLGFFAAIVIQCEDVIIDLNNFEIRQSMEFYITQRFYSHIELGSSPFTKQFGPAHFIAKNNFFTPAKKVTIRNGVLGLSSHHGIHGNNAENIKIENVIIRNYEVAGISINGGQKIFINNCEIGPTSKIVHINGNFAAALQIEKYVDALSSSGDICEPHGPAYLTVNSQNIPSSSIYEEIKKALEKTIKSFLANKPEDIPDFFRNKDGLPEGSSVYGILLHSKNPAYHGFANMCEDDEAGKDIIIKNTKIRDINNSVKETVFLNADSDKNTHDFQLGQRDVRGTMLDILSITDKNGTYHPNVLSNAQLLVSKYKECFSSKAHEFRRRHFHGLTIDRDTISTTVINWVADKNVFHKGRLVCNGDARGYSIKGTMGLRLSGLYDVKLQNLTIENLTNSSPFGSTVCGNYQNNISYMNTVPGYLGADIRGVTVESSKNVHFKNIIIQNLKSENGSVFGVNVMFKSKNVTGNIFTKNFKAPKWKDLPKDFNLIPQSIPLSLPIFITGKAICELDVVHAPSVTSQ